MSKQTSFQEKYLKALDEQERLEKQVRAQSDLLRRLVVYLSAAAANLDPELDATLVNLKEKLKGASGSVVHDQMLRLESVVRQFEDRRGNYHQQSVQSILGIVNNLNQLAVPGDFLSELGQLKRQILKAEYSLPFAPEKLSMLARLHAQAMVLSMEPNQSFWQRLKGGKKLKLEETPTANTSTAVHLSDREEQQQQLDQAGWESVNDEIKEVLDDILETFNTDEQSSAIWQSAKMRMQHNMDWHQLVETLEDFRDLLSERAERTDLGMSEYLNQVNEELHEICERLGVSVEVERKQERAVNALGLAVTQQVQHMQAMVENSSDLEGLKSDISKQITVINSALNEFRNLNSENKPLSEELQELILRVKTIESESERTRQLLAQEQHRANHDVLTELPNRNAYNDRVLQEWLRFKRYKRPLCIAVCDIDHFKSFNDSYGHQIGDRVLRLIAKSLSKRLRSVDFVARYGGEEFVVLLPETNIDNAFKVMDVARGTIAKASFRFKNTPVQITFSCGLTSFDEHDTVDSAFARADKGLYQAKKNGRNQVVSVAASESSH